MRQLLMMALVYAMLLALACAGTAGRNFVKEKQGFEISKVMGMSTAELEKEFGQPQNIFYRGRPDYSRETYLYHYTEKTETSLSSRTLRTFRSRSSGVKGLAMNAMPGWAAKKLTA